MNQHKFNNLIQINAESIGIKTLDNEIIDFLNVEIEEKLKAILTVSNFSMTCQQAQKFMRISKRKTLKVDDLNHSLSFFNFKQLYGYDSYANVEFEKIESVNGLWRPKQNIIDLEDYLSKPIVSCPMQVLPHFHWFAIDGKRPNIPENFIREEYKSPHGFEQQRDIPQVDANAPVHNEKGTGAQPQGRQIGGSKVVPPVIHNISKELQIFLENFEQRFRKEIKFSRLSPNPLFTMTKELQISLTVIETEPGVVELLPYIVEFLMTNLSNQQYVNEPKVHMVILHYVHAILHNPYFYIEPYIHQIVTLILSLILMDLDTGLMDMMIYVKDFAIQILKTIYIKYETKYPKFINQLMKIFKDHLAPDPINPKYLTSYGAIKSINILGPVHVIDNILPKFDDILISLNITHVLMCQKEKNKFAGYEIKDDGNINKINENQNNPLSNVNQMIVDAPSSQPNSFPKISFSLPYNANVNPIINSSIFMDMPMSGIESSSMNQNQQSKQEKVCTVPRFGDKPMTKEIYLGNVKGVVNTVSRKAFYVYYALKESATLVINYISNMENKYSEFIFEKFSDVFGEDLISNLLTDSGVSNVDLDLFI